MKLFVDVLEEKQVFNDKRGVHVMDLLHTRQ